MQISQNGLPSSFRYFFYVLLISQTVGLQENLLKTMIQIEDSFFDLAEASERNCLIICDRGKYWLLIG